jgi:hypothetical protein
MTQVNARSCGISVAALMATSVLISVPATSAPCPNPSNVATPAGYSITAFACGLDFPTAMTLQGDTIWVTEEGVDPNPTVPTHSPPKVKQIDNMGTVTTRLTADQLPAGTLLPPLTGIVFDSSSKDTFYLVHRQTNSKGVPVGVVSRFHASDPVGTFKTIISGFPSFGDHPNSQIVFGADGRAYINGAAPTNSGVVGPDNRWAPNFPNLSDFPGVDIELSGIGYKTLIGSIPPWNLDPEPGGGGTTTAKTTYPFVAFGAPLPAGNKVKAPTPDNPTPEGIIAGGGTVYSFDPNAENPTSTMQLEAWGFRNPYGIGFDPFNKNHLFVSNNGADVRQTTIKGVVTVRGSRPIANDYDDVFLVQIPQNSQGKQNSQGNGNGNGKGRDVPFFGHPDYFHDPVSGKPIPVTDSRFCEGVRTDPITGVDRPLPPPPPFTMLSPCPKFAFSDAFRATLKVQPAFAEIPDNHGSANMFDFSTTDDFGFKGDIFIAETGSIPTGTGADKLTGFKVATIDRGSGKVSDFITHNTSTCPVPDPGLACAIGIIFKVDGFNKPIDVRFRGSEMYIVDFGVSNPATPTDNSGKIWKVTHK